MTNLNYFAELNKCQNDTMDFVYRCRLYRYYAETITNLQVLEKPQYQTKENVRSYQRLF